MRVEFSHKLTGAGGTVVSDLPLFNALAFLTGEKKIITLLDSNESYFFSKQPTQITTRVSYKDAGGVDEMQTIRHNLEIYRDLAYTTLPQSGME